MTYEIVKFDRETLEKTDPITLPANDGICNIIIVYTFIPEQNNSEE